MDELEFKLNDLNEELDETFDRWDREFKKENPIAYWVDNTLFKGKGFLGYAPHHSLTHPLVLLGDLLDKIRWAYQRVWRGWDDRACWSVDSWLDSIMPDILLRLKSTKQGTPIQFYEGLPHDENYNYGDEGDKIAQERWSEELEKMIAGFLASKKINNWEYKTDEELEVLDLVFEKGMKSFVENYHSLWD